MKTKSFIREKANTMNAKMKYYALSLVFTVLSITQLWAYDFNAVSPSGHRLYYTITSNTAPRTVEVVSPTGNGYSGYTAPTGNVVVPETVTYLGNTYKVAKLADRAFYNCTQILTLSLPSSLKYIGNNACYNNYALTSIVIPDSVTFIGVAAFQYNRAMTSVVLPAQLQIIGNHAFNGSSILSSISTIPASVTSIGLEAFHNTAFYNKSSNWVGDALYKDNCLLAVKTTATGNFFIVPSTRIIAGGAFKQCENITGVSMPNSVISIGNNAFEKCFSLSNLNFPSSIIIIGNNAFQECTSLESVVLNHSIKTIGNNAFLNCTALQTVVWNTNAFISHQSNNSGNKPFEGCISLELFVFGDSVRRVCDHALGWGYNGDQNNYFRNLKTIIIGDNVDTIGTSAFESNHNLDSVRWGNSVTTIGDYAFHSVGLKELSIPSTVTTVASRVFENCDSLLSIEIPSSITSIGGYVFYHCDSLKNVIWNTNAVADRPFNECNNLQTLTFGDSVRTIPANAFNGCTNIYTLRFPNTLEYIGDHAFNNCDSIRYVEIPYSVTSVGNEVFRSCDSLHTVVWNSNSWNSSSFNYTPNIKNFVFGDSVRTIPANALKDRTQLQHVTIGNNVDSIGASAFHGCTNMVIDSLRFPNIRYIGASAFRDCTNMDIDSLRFPNTLEYIGDNAFNNCDSIRYVEIPYSVTSVENEVFRSCDSLHTVVWNSNSWNSSSFNYITNIKNFVFGDSVRTIPANALKDRTQLQHVTIGNNVDSIGASAFSGCTNIVIDSLRFPNTLEYIGASAFHGCTNMVIDNLHFPNIRYIGASAFRECTNIIIDSLRFPNTLEYIGGHAFYNCDSIRYVEIPYSVTTVESYAFGYCDNLNTIVWNTNAMTNHDTYGHSNLYQYQFKGCTNLRNFVFGDSVRVISQQALANITSIKSVIIGNNVDSIGSYAFSECTNIVIDSLRFPNTLEYIGSYAFNNCDSIRYVEIPYSVTSLGNEVFRSCDSLHTVVWNSNYWNSSSLSSIPNVKNFVFGDSVRTIPANALSGRTQLQHVTIGNNVDSIYNNAFRNCSNLDTIISYAQIPPIVSNPSSVWYNVPTGTVVLVPCGNGNAYRGSSGWNRFTNIISVVLNNEINLDLSVNNVNYGNVHYNCDNQRLYATANYGYRFVNWSDGNTRNPRPFIYTGDTSFTAIFAKNTYNISITNNARGVFTGAGRYEYLDTVTISAIANYGYSFAYWNDGDSNATRQVVVTANKNYWATFNPNPYTINVVSNDTTMGTVSGAGTYDYNTTQRITAIPTAFEYYLLYWSDGSVENPRIVRVYGDTTYYAIFGHKPTYTLTVLSSNNAIGTVTGSDTALLGSNLEISATANYGYHFARWSDGNTQNPRTIRLERDTAFTAIFERNSYNLATYVNVSNYGSVAGGGNHLYLDTVSITATPNYGYHFTSWNDGDTNNPRQVRVMSDTTFTAVFDRNTYSLACSVNVGNRGNVSGAGNYLYSDNISITATANYGYHFARWSDGNTQNPRTIRLERDTVFTAIFERNTYSVSGAVNVQDRGSVSGVGNYLYLDNASITANANYGYHFTRWSDGNTDNPRILQITGNTTVTAVFDKNIYTLTATANYSDRGTVSGSGTYEYQRMATVRATPNTGYDFTQWSDGSTQRSRSIQMVKDSTITAIFEPKKYTITAIVNSSSSGMGSASGGGTFDYKTMATLTASANYGYHFYNWIDGNTDSIRTVEVLGNANYYANFAPNQYTLNLSVADEAMGTAVGNGSYDYLTEVQIRANSKSGYFFSHWSDGNKDNPRTITLKRDVTLTAYFTDTYVGVEEAEELENLAFYPNPTEGTITFNNRDIKKVEVLDVMGRIVAVYENSYIIDLSKLNKGLYTLRITLPQGVTIRKVVRK